MVTNMVYLLLFMNDLSKKYIGFVFFLFFFNFMANSVTLHYIYKTCDGMTIHKYPSIFGVFFHCCICKCTVLHFQIQVPTHTWSEVCVNLSVHKKNFLYVETFYVETCVCMVYHGLVKWDPRIKNLTALWYMWWCLLFVAKKILE